jgi:hypothetical protein
VVRSLIAAAAATLIFAPAAQAHDTHEAHPNAGCVKDGLGTADVTFDLSPDLTRVRAVVDVVVDGGGVAHFDQLIGPGRSIHADLRFKDAASHTVRVTAELIDTQFGNGVLDREERTVSFVCAPPVEQPSAVAPPAPAAAVPVLAPAPVVHVCACEKQARHRRRAAHRRHHARERRMERRARHRATSHHRPRSTG